MLISLVFYAKHHYSSRIFITVGRIDVFVPTGMVQVNKVPCPVKLTRQPLQQMGMVIEQSKTNAH
jgi:hypothetical protein